MQSGRLKLALMALAIVCAGFWVLRQERELGMSRAENASLRKQIAELRAGQEEDRRAVAQAADAAELTRLRQQQAELLRLRGEVARSRAEARQAAAHASNPSPPPDSAAGAPQSSLTTAVPTRVAMTATFSVRNGETFAAGGWLSAPGTRSFLLATPNLTNAGAAGATINIPLSMLEVPEADLPATLLQKTQSQAGTESAVLTGTDLEFLREMLATGKYRVSRPGISTGDGVPASLFFGEISRNPDGTQRQVGTKVELLPQTAQDGQTIQVGLKLEYMPPDGGAP